ncbi:hypothetical protein [Clostridium thermosuccinogenes]|uniref:hypothetical protein n=1 Tax=Clostridium thermosuccinogenes TaxID=84032 RepID=UPI000CCC0819|nr:hypothetical protein [Pseudoclostridium thermosuccinogenes]PNT93316.1 hypothetical protein CDQ83_07320 [Pseudoclostridium thermosuccinogenes]
MFDASWYKVGNILANIAFVSIPEETFIILFTLVLLKRFEAIKVDKLMEEEISGYKEYSKIFLIQDIKKVAFMVIISAIMSNILRLFNIDSTLLLVICYFSVALSMLFLYRKYFNAIKVFLCTACSFLVFMLIEVSYFPLLLSVTGNSVAELNKNAWVSFLCSLPERAIEYSLLIYVLMKKASFSQLRLANIILNNRFMTVSFCLFVNINILFLLIMGKITIFDQALSSLGIFSQLLISSLAIAFPILNIAIFILTMYHIFNKEEHIRYVLRENIESYVYDMKIFAENGNYKKVDELINEMEEDILNLYDISKNNKGVA